ncbi:hypothetical protein Tco_0447848 [Tanacetum coccineum]
MDDPNITMEEYIRLEEEKARRHEKVFNWETATYGKIWDNEDVHDLRSVETEFPAIVFNDTLTSEAALSCEPTTVYTAYPNLMDTAYRLTGRYPVFIFSTVYTTYSLNEYSVYKYQYDVSWGPCEGNINEYWWRIYKSGNLKVLES